jgi:hypothetical protein
MKGLAYSRVAKVPRLECLGSSSVRQIRQMKANLAIASAVFVHLNQCPGLVRPLR